MIEFFLQEAKQLSNTPKINSFYFLATVMFEFVSNVESEMVYFLENFFSYLLF